METQNTKTIQSHNWSKTDIQELQQALTGVIEQHGYDKEFAKQVVGCALESAIAQYPAIEDLKKLVAEDSAILDPLLQPCFEKYGLPH